ncbi:MAG: type II toxin-antitoxin system VapC family toxin [Gammaproteobacteria bacterium]|nr:type II toxin-antitoxin system VapC family toxin [Gammaproteobacteria bacterium]
MAYLLDTDILSAARRKYCDPNVKQWLCGVNPDALFLSVVTLGEVERGITRQRRINPIFVDELERWLEGILAHYTDRILPLSTTIARRWGRLSAELGHAGADLMIAATALEYGLTIVTRNVHHFETTGVAVFNPYVGSK